MIHTNKTIVCKKIPFIIAKIPIIKLEIFSLKAFLDKKQQTMQNIS